LQRRWQEAGRAWDKALALDPDVGSMQEQVLRMFLEAGLWDDAQRYVAGDLAGPVGEYYQGYLAYRRGDKVRARHIWRKLVEADHGEDVSARHAQAMAWCYLGVPRRALELLLNDVRASGEFSAPAALILALAWAMEGDVEAALSDLGIAAKILRDVGNPTFSQLDWYDFEELVQDEALKSQLRPLFEVEVR
jgi:tetratricopeptide (TPR) repeat protein